MKIRIGIDIGKSGGLALFHDGIHVESLATPQIANEIDVTALHRKLWFWIVAPRQHDAGSDIHVVIEDVHSIFGASAKSNFQFGRSAGIIEGVLHSFKVPFTKVTPKTWQKEIWEGVEVIKKAGKKSNDTKAMSLVALKRLYPNVSGLATTRSTVPHDGIVDAVLIAAYCSRKF